MGRRRGAAEEELMTCPQHVSPNKGCRAYALGSDDEQDGAQHHRRRGDDALDGVRASGKRAKENTRLARVFCVSLDYFGKLDHPIIILANINPIFSSRLLSPLETTMNIKA
jgi:hypothetical protein